MIYAVGAFCKQFKFYAYKRILRMSRFPDETLRLDNKTIIPFAPYPLILRYDCDFDRAHDQTLLII